MINRSAHWNRDQGCQTTHVHYGRQQPERNGAACVRHYLRNGQARSGHPGSNRRQHRSRHYARRSRASSGCSTARNPKDRHCFLLAPQIRYPDCYGIDMSKLGDFVAFRAAVELLKNAPGIAVTGIALMYAKNYAKTTNCTPRMSCARRI